ncbi:MAG: CDP-alcohol phosphatidyltransferase family protein [Deltaproteobacteria bacterium]|nr:CDP-alcohol phosphatidyltransferase family protein [Deltaproteobacteria bacterium]
MNTSTKLTVSRLAAAPIYLLSFLFLGTAGKWVCLALLWWAAFSDVMDGKIARKRGEISDLGKFLDPIADSTFFVTVFFCFTWVGLMPLWMLLLIVIRESFQNAFLRPYCNARGIVVAAKKIGKAKTVTQSIVSQIIVTTLGLHPFILGSISQKTWEIWTGSVCYALLGGVTLLSVTSLYPYVMTLKQLPAAGNR